jgi:two-component system LytT family response regulator
LSGETVVRALIVDDEPLARRGIRKRLQAHPDVEVVGEFESADDAVEAIRSLRPDLVFLDIQMPGATGFSVIERADWRARLLALIGTDGGRVETGLSMEPGAPAPAPRPERLAVRDSGRILLLDPGEIDWIEAEGDYVRVHCGARGYLIREGISSIEARLAETSLVRIHRSTIVNVSRVQELRPRENQDFTVVLANGTSLRLSRTYRAPFERACGYRLDR